MAERAIDLVLSAREADVLHLAVQTAIAVVEVSPGAGEHCAATVEDLNAILKRLAWATGCRGGTP